MSNTQNRLSIGRLFTEQRGRLQQYLRKRLTNDADAQELAQEAYLRLLRVKRVDLIRYPEAYLYRIARNLVHELYTGKPVATNCPLDDLDENEEPELQRQSPEDAVEQKRWFDRIERVLNEVSPKCRAALLLYWREGMTQQEIADRLSLSRSMVQKYMVNGLAHCQKRLREYDER